MDRAREQPRAGRADRALHSLRNHRIRQGVRPRSERLARLPGRAGIGLAVGDAGGRRRVRGLAATAAAARNGKLAVMPTANNFCAEYSVNRKLAALSSFCEYPAPTGCRLAIRW